MKRQKHLSILMILALSFTTFINPMVTFADNDLEVGSQIEMEQSDADAVLNDVVVDEAEDESEETVEEEAVVKQEEKEPVKNKGDPVKKKQKKGTPEKEVAKDVTKENNTKNDEELEKKKESIIQSKEKNKVNKRTIGSLNNVEEKHVSDMTDDERDSLNYAIDSNLSRFITKSYMTPLIDENASYEGKVRYEYEIPAEEEISANTKYIISTYSRELQKFASPKDVDTIWNKGTRWIPSNDTDDSGRPLVYYSYKDDGLIEVIFSEDIVSGLEIKGWVEFNFLHVDVEKKILYQGKELDYLEVNEGEPFKYLIRYKIDENSESESINHIEDIFDERLEENWDRVKAYDQYGDDYTSQLRIGGGEISLLPTLDKGKEDHRGKIITIEVDAKIREGAKFNEEIPNVASIALGTNHKQSNEVVVKKVKNEFPITPIEPAKSKVSVEKVWKGKKQDSVTINLLADGKQVDSIKLSDENDWKHTFTDLPVVNDIKDEKAIEYTIEEVEIAGYEVTIDGDAKDGFIITNLRVDKVDIPVTKTWKDNITNDRPSEIEVDLLRNGKVIETVRMTADNEWKHTFKGLEQYDKNGKEYVYSIVEKPVKNYTSVVNETEEGFRIVNTIDEPVVPPIVKDVEGKEHLDIVRNKEYNYNIKTVIPENIAGYKDLTIADVLDNRLSVVKVDVLVDGEESDFEAAIKGQEVVLKLDRKQLDGIAGKELNLRITARINSGVDVELIDNKATLQLNDNPNVDSNTVTVKPPGPITPSIKKDVEGKEHLDIDRNKEYKYNVKTDIPEEIGGYKTLTIKDGLDNRLTVINADVLVDGEVSEYEATIDGQMVTLVLDREQLDGLVGKEINLQITAKINEDVEMDVIENTATLQFNDEPEIESNIVTVKPSKPEEPKAEKPEVPEPIEPEAPEVPKQEKPDKPITEKEEIIFQKPENAKGKSLPNTATDMFNYLLIGFGLMLVGGSLYYVRKRRKSEE